MTATIKLLDMYREICSLPSDNQLALKIGVTRGSVSNWRQGRNHAEPESVALMAKACGLDPEEWVLRVQADREILAVRKQVWLRAAQRLASTAALVAITFGLAVYTPKAHATEAAQSFAKSGDFVYYVKYSILPFNLVVSPHQGFWPILHGHLHCRRQ